MQNFENSAVLFDQPKTPISQASQKALHAVEMMNLPKKIALSLESFEYLGHGLTRVAEQMFHGLTAEFAEKLPELLGIAVHECHYAAWVAAYTCAETDFDFDPSMYTSEGYAEDEGWAYTMYEKLEYMTEDLEQVVFRKETSFTERIPSQALLRCMAVFWLSKASDLNRDGKTLEAQDWIFEGLDARSLVEGLLNWDDGGEVAVEEHSEKEKLTIKAKLSEKGKAAANARHDQPGSSRDKQKAIRAIWATGKYLSRDLCAEQECAALNMAPGTARRALRNTPEPLRRCTA